MQDCLTEYIEVRVGSTTHCITGPQCVLGRDASSCDVIVEHPTVSRRHVRIWLKDEHLFIQDLGSRNGTFVNGEQVKGECMLGSKGTFRMGDVEVTACLKRGRCDADDTGVLPVLVEAVRRELLQKIDVFSASGEEIQHYLVDILKSHGYDPGVYLLPVMRDVVGYGPIEEFINDESISEIMVNGPGQVYVERHGKLELTPVFFASDEEVVRVIERIVAPLGRRIDESQPYVDARLPDGSRVNAVIPPLSLIGPVLTIRKFSRRKLGINDLISFGSLTSKMAEFLRLAVEYRKNIVVSGGTGSGKTTLLNVIASFIPSGERIVTIEDAAELRLPQEHVVPLEARPPNIEGRGAVTIRDLVRNSLRMRPDRIVVGECRGGEALDMLQAMNTGHSGSMTTLHANSPRDAISRLATLALMAGIELPLRAVYEWITSAVDIVVQVERFRDGSRRITSIVELGGMEGDVVVLREIFRFVVEGVKAERVTGRFVATGVIPDFIHELRERGVPVELDIFGGA